MKQIIRLDRIEKEIAMLPDEDLIRLLDSIVHRLKKPVKREPVCNWQELYGAGKGLWQKDAQDYVNSMREER